jgi:hypothetical protein
VVRHKWFRSTGCEKSLRRLLFLDIVPEYIPAKQLPRRTHELQWEPIKLGRSPDRDYEEFMGKEGYTSDLSESRILRTNAHLYEGFEHGRYHII